MEMKEAFYSSKINEKPNESVTKVIFFVRKNIVLMK